MSGIDKIVAERDRQINENGYDTEHDDDHVAGELALAAIALASPEPVFVGHVHSDEIMIRDPWPFEEGHDTRLKTVVGSATGLLPPPKTRTPEERIKMLVQGGALLAAEIDRCERAIEAGNEVYLD